jgi:gliding motility-associated-like protein
MRKIYILTLITMFVFFSEAQTVYDWSGYQHTGNPTWRGRTFTRDGYTFTKTPAGGTTMTARVSKIGATSCTETFDAGAVVVSNECFSNNNQSFNCPPVYGTWSGLTGLLLGNDWTNKSTSNQVDISFLSAVCCPVHFQIRDINTNSNFCDDIIIFGINQLGDTVYPSSVTGIAAPYQYNSSNGNIYNSSPTTNPSGMSDANVTVTFGTGSIKSMRVAYRSNQTLPVGGNNPSYQYIIIGNITAGPTLSVIASPPTICDGGSTNLDATNGFTNYTWNPGGMSGEPVTVSPSGTTTYSVTATTATCTLTSEVTVNVSSINLSAYADTTICEGQSVNIGATADPGTSFFWPGGLNGSNITVSPSATTTYTVTGTSGSCNATASVTVTVVDQPNIIVSPVNTSICIGESVTISASGTMTYAWTHGLGSGSSHTVSPITTTTYTVTGSDGNCSSTAQITVEVLPPQDASILTSGPFCSNGGTIQFNAVDAGGVWSGNGITSGGLFDPATAATGTNTITYGITGSCGDTASVIITVYDAPIVDLGPDIGICDGDVIVLDAGAGFIAYDWTPSGSSQTININSSGSYIVTVTDANNCQGTDVITITVQQTYDASILTSGPFCSNGGTIQFNALDAGGVWSGNGITSGGLFDPATAATGTNTITYGITGSCGDTASVIITVYDAPIVDLGPDIGICDGDVIVLDAGAGFIAYDWTPSGSSQTININSSGSYIVTVTDANNCQGTDVITITVQQTYDASILTSGPFCSNGGTIQFNAVDAGGVWSGNGITSGGLFDPATAATGTNTITYGITGSCGDTASVIITVYASPIVDLGPDIGICDGDVIVLDAGVGVSYLWLPSGNTQTIDITSSGTYSVTVTDSNGCQGSDSVTITVLEQQDATILSDGPFCANDLPIQFLAEDGGGTWTGSGITLGGMYSPSGAGPGNHSITYTIPGQCGDTDSKIITVHEVPQISLSTIGESCIGATDGSISMILTGGTAPYVIQWNNGSNLQNLSDLTPGTYYVLIADQNGCIDSSSVTVLSGIDDCLPPHVYVPNIFSPNGDGQNDILFVRGEGIKYLEFNIFNRWGEKVFETTNKNIGWDGTYKGKLCNPAVFAYVLKVTFTNNEVFVLKGNISLVH